MSNKYNSNLRTYRARNVYESTITPPNDFTIAQANWVPQLFRPHDFLGVGSDFDYPLSSNLIIKRLGLFCNFADGLVWASPTVRLDLLVLVYGMIPVTRTGVVTFTVDSKTVTGVGTNFVGQFTPNGFILDPATMTPYKIRSITNPATMVLTDYALFTSAGVQATSLTGTIASGVMLHQMAEFNYMYDLEHFFSVASLPGISILIPQVTIYNSGNNALNLYTISIDTTYGGKNILFDVVADFEITEATT